MYNGRWKVGEYNFCFILFSVFYKEHVFIKQKMKQKPKNKVVY